MSRSAAVRMPEPARLQPAKGCVLTVWCAFEGWGYRPNSLHHRDADVTSWMRYSVIVDLQDVSGERAIDAIIAVLPPKSDVARVRPHEAAGLSINGQQFRVTWVGEGRPDSIRRVIAERDGGAQIVVARRLSVSAREALSEAGISWVDESGAAQISGPSIVVALSGTPPKPPSRPSGWTSSVLAIAEALLCGTKATASAMVETTGLSMGSCVNALRALTGLGLLEANVGRGPGSARHVIDDDRLLDAYSAAAPPLAGALMVEVGVTWRDTNEGIMTLARRWDDAGIDYAVTGPVAASLLAPYLTLVNRAEVYVASDTQVGLQAAATAAGLRPVPGGRLTLRPFPTVATNRLARPVSGLRLAPWPRVYVDLFHAGVRGEDAADHLKDVIRDR